MGRPHSVIEKTDWNYAHLKAFLPEDRDAKILDVGCGNGRHMAALRDLGYSNVTGIDLFQSIPAHDLNYRKGSITNIPFDDGTFDFVYSFGSVVSHAEIPEQWTKEFARVLKPGGRCLVTAHTKHSTFTAWRYLMRFINHRNWQHLRGFHFVSTQRIRDALRHAGLTEIVLTGYKPSIFWLVRPMNNHLVMPVLAKVGVKIPYMRPWVTKSAIGRRINSVIGYHAVYFYEKRAKG